MESLLQWLGWNRLQRRGDALVLRFRDSTPPTPAPTPAPAGGTETTALELTPWSIARLTVITAEVIDRPCQAALEAARSARSCLSRFWIAAPLDALETLFSGPIGEVYRQLLAGALPALPLTAAESAWRDQLAAVLAAGFEQPGSVNALLALLPYLDREAMQVTNPLQHLPAWLVPLYAERCDPGLSAQPSSARTMPQLPPVSALPPPLPELAPITGAAAMALIGDAGFLGRVNGLINLYGLDPGDPEICRDLGLGRRQVAQVWLDVESEQLESLYRTPFGQLTDTLIASPFLREPLSPDERALRQQLAELAADLQHPRALNALIAALLYYPMDQVSLPADPDLLPPWLAESLTRLGARAASQGSSFA